MIKKLAWNIFKNTGDINSYIEFAKLESAEGLIKNNILLTEEKNNTTLKQNIDENK